MRNSGRAWNKSGMFSLFKYEVDISLFYIASRGFFNLYLLIIIDKFIQLLLIFYLYLHFILHIEGFRKEVFNHSYFFYLINKIKNKFSPLKVGLNPPYFFFWEKSEKSNRKEGLYIRNIENNYTSIYLGHYIYNR